MDGAFSAHSAVYRQRANVPETAQLPSSGALRRGNATLDTSVTPSLFFFVEKKKRKGRERRRRSPPLRCERERISPARKSERRPQRFARKRLALDIERNL